MVQTILYSFAVFDGAPPNRPAGEMNKTSLPPIDSIDRQWYVVDAENQTLGRLATEVASILRGKNNPSFTPHLDTGDFVVVVNAEKIQVSGRKPQQKLYRRHSGRPGGMKVETFESLQERIPERIVEKAIKGMLPHNALGRQMFRKLKVYKGTEQGRRKTSVARVRLVPGNGTITINGRPGDNYLNYNPAYLAAVKGPLETLGLSTEYDILVNVHGGGLTGQSGAIKQGAARALCELSADNRKPLKTEGHLSRDPRAKERRKYGLKKARKAPQFSKR